MLSCNSLFAKKANAIWYFLAKTEASVCENEHLSVQYGIYTKCAVPEYNLGPYPTMRIKVTNKSEKILYVDLGTSYIKKNAKFHIPAYVKMRDYQNAANKECRASAI